MEGKSNETGLVWRSDRVVWRGLILQARLSKDLDHRDPVLAHGLAARVKYVRLVRRRMGEKTRFWVHLIVEGTAYQKPEHTLGEGTVGLDLGPSTIAIVAEHEARLERFCADLDPEVGSDPAGAAASRPAATSQEPGEISPRWMRQDGPAGPEILAGVPKAKADAAASGPSAAQASRAS